MLSPVSLETPIEILLNVILQKYFSSFHCLTIFSETPLQLNYSSQFMYFSPNEHLVPQIMEASESGCSDYVIHMSDPSRFMEAFETVTHKGNVRRSDRKLIFLPFKTLNNSENDLLAVLTMKEITFVPNVLLILPTKIESHEAFDLVTHVYEGDNNKSRDPLIIDQWDIHQQRFLKDVNLFPHDLTNLQGKIVKVAAFTYTPYVILGVEDRPCGSDGTEIRIIEEFCRWVNCTMEIVTDDDEWGEIFENLTGIGVLGNVVEDRADFAITALYSWYEEYVELDFSASCVRTSITCLAPAPRLLVSWQTPLLPFSADMWLALGLTFIFASFSLMVVQGFSTRNIFMTTFGMMITQSQAHSGSSWRVRSVTGWLLLTGLIIDNAYGGGLATVFTVPKYEPSIDTIKDIVERKVEWGATQNAWVFSLTLSQDELIKSLVSQFRTYPPKELQSKSLTRSMAYSIEKLPAGYFAIGDYITEEAIRDMSIMLEDFYYEYSVIMMRKSSPFTEKISSMVGRLHQSGLVLAWERQVALKYLNYNIQLEVKLSRSKRDVENVRPLQLSQVMGIFLFYGAGVVTATILFFIEFFCCKNK